MGSSNKREKLPKIIDAEIMEDGMILIEMNLAAPLGNSKKVLLPPETLWELVNVYGSIPPADDTDFPGVPILEVDDVFPEGEEVDQGDDGDTQE